MHSVAVEALPSRAREALPSKAAAHLQDGRAGTRTEAIFA